MSTRTRSLRTTGLSLLVAASLVLVAGCGGGGLSKDEYEQEMRTVASDITKASTEVASMQADAKPAERAAIIQRQGKLLAAAADKADGIDPPEDAKSAHDDFVTALHAYAKLLDELADASKSAKATQRQAALLSDAGEEVDRLTRASNELAKAGYTFQSKK